MTLSIKTKLIAVTVASAATIAALVAAIEFGTSALTEKLRLSHVITVALRNHTNADMMHDALRADVYAALLFGGESADRKAEILGDVGEHASEFRKYVAETKALTLPQDVRVPLEALEQPLADYIATVENLVGVAVTNRAKAEALLPGFQEQFHTLELAMGEAGDKIEQFAASGEETVSEFARFASWVGNGGLVIGAVIAGFALWVMHFDVLSPLAALAAALQRLAKGDYGVALPTRRKDEIGDMARSAQTLRDAGVEKLRLEGLSAEQRQAAEQERQRNEGAQREATEVQSSVVRALATGLHSLADGDLTFRLTQAFPDAYREVRDDFNVAVERLGETVRAIASAAREVAGASAEISEGTGDLSKRTEDQSASLEATTASMTEIAKNVRKNSENADLANQLAAGTREVAGRGSEVVSEVVEAMARIESSSGRIADIIGVIDDIARQTNLLALNAAVEAARAGDAGRGFAVVASEVRSLAERSSQAARDIKGLIVNSSGQVKDGVELVNRAGGALSEIVASIDKVAAVVSEIASATRAQSDSVDQVNRALTQMDEVTQQNAALVEENAAAASALQAQSSAVDRQVSFFRLGEAGSPSAAAVPATAIGKRPPVEKRAAASPVAKPASRPAAARGGAVGRMQAAVANSFAAKPPVEADWAEF
ncbi:MAG: methyl-accepting chemotaxis protein [Bauldia sp.]